MGKKNTLAAGAAVLAATALAGCSSQAVGKAIDATPPIQTAYDTCVETYDVPEAISLGDDGHTVVVDGLSDVVGSDTDFSVLGCLLNELDTPQSVTSQMDSTTALMGYQEAQAEGLSYGWSYHPDNGIDMTITDVD